MAAMNHKFRRILFATDLSDDSTYVLPYAIQLARENLAKVVIFHVIKQRSIQAAKTLAYLNNETDKDIVKEKTNSAIKRMKEQLQILRKKEFKDHPELADRVESMIIHHGKVAEEIVEKANRFGFDAIVLGSPKRRFLRQILMPSTAQKVLRRTKKPVFMASMRNGKINIDCYNT
jgi:nucleotide-binding universal stress UspA family protein